MITESVKQFRFTRKERLKGRTEIKEAFARGRKASCPGAKLFVVENGSGKNRIAFTFARKFGNAVERNRSRRLSREAYRLGKVHLKSGFDLVLLVYPGRDDLPRRTEQLTALFMKAGLLSENASK
jgi:ribonuclease P protein component